MTIITHLIALMVGATFGIGLMALLVASRNAEENGGIDEH